MAEEDDMEETSCKRSKHGGDFGEEYRAKVEFTNYFQMVNNCRRDLSTRVQMKIRF